MPPRLSLAIPIPIPRTPGDDRRMNDHRMKDHMKNDHSMNSRYEPVVSSYNRNNSPFQSQNHNFDKYENCDAALERFCPKSHPTQISGGNGKYIVCESDKNRNNKKTNDRRHAHKLGLKITKEISDKHVKAIKDLVMLIEAYKEFYKDNEYYMHSIQSMHSMYPIERHFILPHEIKNCVQKGDVRSTYVTTHVDNGFTLRQVKNMYNKSNANANANPSKRKITRRDILGIQLQLTFALNCLFYLGFKHNDVSLDNVMIKYDPDPIKYPRKLNDRKLIYNLIQHFRRSKTKNVKNENLHFSDLNNNLPYNSDVSDVLDHSDTHWLVQLIDFDLLTRRRVRDNNNDNHIEVNGGEVCKENEIEEEYGMTCASKLVNIIDPTVQRMNADGVSTQLKH